MATIIPAPLRQLIAECDSLQTQLNMLQTDYDSLLQEKANKVAEYDGKLQILDKRKTDIQNMISQYNQAIETMKQQFQIPEEPTTPPTDTNTTTTDTTTQPTQ